jgi:hypothetical protein
MFPGMRSSLKSWLILVGCGVLAVSLAGCGKSGSKLVQVAGKVTAGNKPLTTGTVIFYPDAGRGNTSKEEPRGDIDSEGNYRLLTGIQTGAAAGWYKVAVTAADQVDPKNPYFTKWLIPEKYIDPRTSKLTIEVVASPAAGAYDLKLDAK